MPADRPAPLRISLVLAALAALAPMGGCDGQAPSPPPSAPLAQEPASAPTPAEKPAAESPAAESPAPAETPLKGARTLAVGDWRVVYSEAEAHAEHSVTKARVELYSDKKGREGCFSLQDERPELGEFEYELRGALLSVVGDIVSVRIDEGGFCGGAHPFVSTSYEAWRLSTGQRVKLHELFERAAIDRALDADEFVQKVRADDMKDCEHSYYLPTSSELTNFAFHHRDGDKVAVRLGLTHSVEICRGQFAEVGLYLEPAEQTLKQALASAEEAGLLMQQLKPRTKPAPGE